MTLDDLQACLPPWSPAWPASLWPVWRPGDGLCTPDAAAPVGPSAHERSLPRHVEHTYAADTNPRGLPPAIAADPHCIDSLGIAPAGFVPAGVVELVPHGTGRVLGKRVPRRMLT